MDSDSVDARSDPLSKALDRYFAQYFSRHPVNATFTGLHALDDRLPDWSPAGLAQQADEMRRLRGELNDTANPTNEQLRTSTIALDDELARANLDVRLAESDSGFFHHRNPALWTGEAIFGVVSLMIRDFAPIHQRLPAIVARLRAIPSFLAQMTEVVREPIPPQWIARAVRECVAADGLFDRGLSAWIGANGVDASASAALHAAAVDAREAFATTESWLRSRPGADDTSCAAGREMFVTLLTRGHYCDSAPESLLQEAEVELAVAQAALASRLAPIAATWEEAQRLMALDHPGVDDYYATFQRRWEECRRIVQAHNAVTWEDWPIRYVPIPAWAQEWAPQLYWLFYRSPAPFDPYTVYDYVVTPIDGEMDAEEREARLQAWNHGTIALNHVIHHGAVGHHVQNWHARYRAQSRIGRIAATDCASRIAMFLGGSMAEGWACYATQLMGELGMLSPLEELSEHHTSVRMLARAIVDIRLHLGHISFADAVQYYQDTVGMPVATATAEATKNSMFPCTAIMYWLGTRQIVAARTLVQAARGNEFSLRDFHDELLSRGAIPVALAVTLMTEHLA